MFKASGKDRDAKDALFKLLQMGTVGEYESKFVMLLNRVTRISENLLKSFYISGLKPTIQCALLRSNPTTLDEAFSLSHATEARFVEDTLSKILQMGTVAEYQNKFEMLIIRVTGIFKFLLKSFYISGLKLALQIELVRTRPTTLVEAFSLALITETHFEDENNQAVDNNVGDQEDTNVNDKQEVKKADDQEIKNVKDKESENVEDQQVFEADDDTNNDYFDCSLTPHKGDDLTVEKVVFKNTTSDLKKNNDEQGKKKKKWVIKFSEVGANKDNNPNGLFNDVCGVGYSKANGTWVPARRIKDGWYLFDELGLSKEPHYKSNLDVHLQFHVD
nr:retrotransposon Gag protein [Tanacetum cinerariifolium]